MQGSWGVDWTPEILALITELRASRKVVEAAENLAYEVGYVLQGEDLELPNRTAYLREPLERYHSALAELEVVNAMREGEK